MDLNLYYDEQNLLRYKRPDWFGVLGVPRLYDGHDLRWSYVIWQEGITPLIVVELLPDSTQKHDLGQTAEDEDGTPTKWHVYEQILEVPYYVVFSRSADRMRLFKLTNGRYIEQIGHQGRYWIPETGLGLGVWRGSYKDTQRLWLRWYDADSNWIATPEEEAQANRRRAHEEHFQAERERRRANRAERQVTQMQQQAAQAQQQAEQERQRAERMAELLRQLGHNPEQL